MQKHDQPQRAYVPLDGGRCVGEVVRASDPETGAIVAHTINRTQLVVDELLHRELIDGAQWAAAEALRGLHAQARAIPDARAVDPRRIGAGDQPEPDPIAEREFRRIMRVLGREARRIVQVVALDNERPAFDERSLGHVRAALEELARVMHMA